MASAQGQYTKEMKKKFGGYYATWIPGLPLALGDVGVIRNNVFTKLGNIKEPSIGIKFTVLQDPTPIDLEHSSQGSVKTTIKLSGTVAPQGSALAQGDAGIILEFSKSSATFFKVKNATSPSIADTIDLGNKVLELFKAGKWNKDWVVVTELMIAESGTVVISSSADGKIEVKANANVDAANLDIADAKFAFSRILSRSLETHVIAAKELTPLFKVMGIKSRLFKPKTFETREYKSIDLITPESAKKEHKDQVYFGIISSEVTE